MGNKGLLGVLNLIIIVLAYNYSLKLVEK